MVAQAISRILVERLFGIYDYDLRPSAEAVRPERIMILYGDNGSGKTTILRTLFHLLAPHTDQGHRTALLKVPFQSFRVDLTSGDYVWAEREPGYLLGSYTLGIGVGGKKFEQLMVQGSDGKIAPEDDHDQFVSQLCRLNLDLYLLADDRSIHLTGQDPDADTVDEFSVHERLQTLRHAYRGQVSDWVEEPEERANRLLTASLQRVETWIREQARQANTAGELSVNTLYGEMIRRLANSEGDTSPGLDLKKRIASLQERSLGYSRYGLAPTFIGEDLARAFNKAKETQRSLIETVVAPYLDSVEKRLEALLVLQQQIDSMVSTINSFYTKKSLQFDVDAGFQLQTDAGQPLSLHSLSSGERHLLLLFCNTLLALDKPSVFIIDEPELSLNIKWQRRLLSSLLQCVGDRAVQYVLATHSLELQSQHRTNTIKLNPSGGKPDVRAEDC